jgi:hypothetical protein
MIPRLGGIVEQGHAVGFPRGPGHELIEGQFRELGARDEFVQGLDV